MAGKSDFSVEQWDLLRQAPFAASLVVVAARPSGPIGLVKESVAATKLIVNAAVSAKTPLLQSLAQDLKQTVSMPKMFEGASRSSIQETALNTLKQASALVAGKAAPEEAGEFKEWLGTIAQRTAEAAKEGGFLGFGGSLVSGEENAAIAAIHSALGTRAA